MGKTYLFFALAAALTLSACGSTTTTSSSEADAGLGPSATMIMGDQADPGTGISYWGEAAVEACQEVDPAACQNVLENLCVMVEQAYGTGHVTRAGIPPQGILDTYYPEDSEMRKTHAETFAYLTAFVEKPCEGVEMPNP